MVEIGGWKLTRLHARCLCVLVHMRLARRNVRFWPGAADRRQAGSTILATAACSRAGITIASNATRSSQWKHRPAPPRSKCLIRSGRKRWPKCNGSAFRCKIVAATIGGTLQLPNSRSSFGQRILPGVFMKKFEYKTLVLPFRVGIFKQGVPDIKAACSAQEKTSVYESCAGNLVRSGQ